MSTGGQGLFLGSCLCGIYVSTPASFMRVGHTQTGNSKFHLGVEWECKWLRRASLFVCCEFSVVFHSCMSSLVTHFSSPPLCSIPALYPFLGLLFHRLYHNKISSFPLDFFFLAISSLASLQIKAIKSPLITHISSPHLFLFILPHFYLAPFLL